MSDTQETPKIKYYEKFLSNVSGIKIGSNADPVIVKELMDNMKKYTNH
jgi:hypothetical protein